MHAHAAFAAVVRPPLLSARFMYGKTNRTVGMRVMRYTFHSPASLTPRAFHESGNTNTNRFTRSDTTRDDTKSFLRPGISAIRIKPAFSAAGASFPVSMAGKKKI